jgi:beta-lactamase superfamily II metal-dependent hydrolase
MMHLCRNLPRCVRIAGISFASLVLLTSVAAAQPKKLRVYFFDVEGGQSTLFVTPAGESLLIDTGWPDNNGRDADRIVSVAKQAGLDHLDYVLITHFHTDHVGGVPQLVARIPVRTFIDHGSNRETTDASTVQGFEAYQKVLAETHARRINPKPGDVLPVKGIHAEVISEDGNLIDHALPGAGEPNPFCAGAEQRPADQTENARSLGLLLTFGKLKLLDLGDLTSDKEMQLVCPANKLGRVDIYIVSHHGWYQSSSPAMVDALHARVAIMDNGAKKGGSTPTLETIAKAPGLETLWQLHYSEEGGPAHNTKAEYIANPEGPDAGNPLELTASPDGSFAVYNPRTKATRNYPAR